jgi:hypothetical protein
VSHEGAFGRAMILSNVGSLDDKALFPPQPPEKFVGSYDIGERGGPPIGVAERHQFTCLHSRELLGQMLVAGLRMASSRTF